MFITKDDLNANIRAYRLSQILDDDTDGVIVGQVLETAEQLVKDHLFQHYDTEVLFLQSGAARKKNVLGWCRHIAMYQLYERVPDELVPERIVKNYNETMDFLMKVAEGRFPVDLPRRTATDPETGLAAPKTKTRWGSQPSRSHNL